MMLAMESCWPCSGDTGWRVWKRRSWSSRITRSSPSPSLEKPLLLPGSNQHGPPAEAPTPETILPASCSARSAVWDVLASPACQGSLSVWNPGRSCCPPLVFNLRMFLWHLISFFRTWSHVWLSWRLLVSGVQLLVVVAVLLGTKHLNPFQVSCVHFWVPT